MNTWRRWTVSRLGLVLGVAIVLMSAGGSKPGSKSPPPNDPPEPIAGQTVKQANLEYLGVWVGAARESFARVRDYQCTLTKRERIDGVLQEEQVALMKVREKPFSVYLKFTAPRAAAGREGSYVQGRNGGKMRAKAGGALGLVGYVTLQPTDPKAMMGSRHAITEAGIGNLIDRLSPAQAGVQTGRPAPQVIVTEYVVAKRTCVRIDVTDPAADGIQNQHRTVIYFDRETNLPVRYEAFDRQGELVELFAYTDLRFNIGLTDATFP